MSNKKYGLGYERKEKHYLESQGYQAFRCRGSFGVFDIIAHNGEQWLLTSVKSTRMKKKSYKSEINKVLGIACPSDTLKRIVTYHKGQRHIIWEQLEIGL